MMHSYSDDKTKLPLQYILVHDYCCDILLDIVPFLFSSENEDLRAYSFDIKKIPTNFDEFNSLEILNWLKKNGYKEQHNKYFLIYIFKGILADFCEYLEFSLIASRRSRVNVALNLIRKPFLENLIVLEQILTKPEQLIEHFTESKPEVYNPTNEKDKRGLIEDCLTNHVNNMFFKSDLIYTLRYDKNNPNSFYALSNRAVHLVTTRNKSYRTQNFDFNLVFVPESNFEEFWDHYYNFIPMLLYYAVEIIEAIVLREVKQKKEEYQFRKFSRLIGFLFITELLNPLQAKKDSALDKLSGQFDVTCPNCSKKNVLFKSDYNEIYSNKTLCCKHCLCDMIEDKKILNDFYHAFNI